MTKIDFIEEPIAKVEILVPSDMIGNVMELVQNRPRRISDHGIS